MNQPPLDRTTRRATLDRAMYDLARPVVTSVAFVYAVLTLAHTLVLPPGVREIMTVTAAVSTALFLIARRALVRDRIGVESVRYLLFGIALVFLFNSLLHLALLQEPWQATNLILIALGVAFILLDTRLFGGVILLIALGWIGLVSQAPESPLWGHFSFALFLAIVMATVMHRVLVAQRLRLEALHLKDLERQEHLEEALLTARESSRSKSLFLAQMSHELRTPLNAVIGFTNILLKNRRGSLSEKELLYLERIASNGHHLLGLIDQLLDLSRIEAGRPNLRIETFDLVTLIAEVAAELEPLATEKSLALDIETPSTVGAIESDRRRLKQILFNLVGNAIKFTEEGHVTIQLLSGVDGEPFRIAVADSGIGIPEDRLRKIFEAFEQVDGGTRRRFPGTGLGLAISRNLCQHLGYHLSVTSTLGEGSVFTLTLGDPSPGNPKNGEQCQHRFQNGHFHRRGLDTHRCPLSRWPPSRSSRAVA